MPPFLPGSTGACAPFWRPRFAPLVGKLPLRSGFSVVTNPEDPNFGLIPADPGALRADAEAQMARAGFPRAVSLDAYSLARNIQTEVGDASVEMKMALALSTIAQARRRGVSPSALILANSLRGDRQRQPAYGTIGGPFIRFTSSSKDPTVVDVLVAQAALEGLDPTFARGADDQFGPNQMPVATAVGEVGRIGGNHDYWVGPITNVNPRTVFLTARRPEIDPGSPDGQALIAAGVAAVSDLSPPPVVTKVCATPVAESRGGGGFVVAALAVGAVLGGGLAFVAGRRVV